MNIQTKIDETKSGVAYNSDFALWALEQARLLGEGRFSELDIVNLMDEVESLGRSQRNELRKRLKTLIEHLLKFRHGLNDEPKDGWRNTINDTRSDIVDLVADTPSLRPQVPELFNEAWRAGRTKALIGFWNYERSRYADYKAELPENPDFSVEEALREDFFPALHES